MAAYLFPVSNLEWAYVIGPRGMAGKAKLATDGGESFTLANADASIVFRHVGGSPFIAQGGAAQFFPAAGAALNRAGLGIKWTAKDLLHPATLSYRYNHRVALFSFASKSGRSVYGYAFYQRLARRRRGGVAQSHDGVRPAGEFTRKGHLPSTRPPAFCAEAQQRAVARRSSDRGQGQ